MKRLWVMPANDGEAIEIRRLLDERHERTLVTRQPWGASWGKLEAGIVRELAQTDSEVIGVELSGKPPVDAVNIDHHVYAGDDRTHPLSSLEQIAFLLGVRLSQWRRLVAANDRGYIPALENECAAARSTIEKVRTFDRRAQGVTRAMELQAWKLVRDATPKGSLWILPAPKELGSACADFLFLYRGAREWLFRSPERWAYSGPKSRMLRDLPIPENHWSGGSGALGFYGVAAPGVETQRMILRELTQPDLKAEPVENTPDG